MSKYIVETYYTCSFKIVHKLDELNESKLSELQNRNDGEIEIIDVNPSLVSSPVSVILFFFKRFPSPAYLLITLVKALLKPKRWVPPSF